MSYEGRDLNVYQVQVISKEKFIEQELLSKINKSDFKKKWTLWKDLFFRNLKKIQIREFCEIRIPSQVSM